MGQAYIYINGECVFTQKLIWGILGQSCLSIKFSTLMIREAKGPMLNAGQIGSQCHPRGFNLLVTTLDGWGLCMRLECEMKYVCIDTHSMHVWMYIHVEVCGDNDVRDNNELADELSQACRQQGQKHAVCVFLCYNQWVCGVGKSVIFKILTM